MRRLLYNPACAAAALLCVAAGPAFAGAVYVPLATNADIGGVRLRTEVSIANTRTAAGPVKTFFIPTNANGTVRPAGNQPATVQIAGGVTQILPPVADGATGLLEISGNPGFEVSARVFTRGEGVYLPVISSDNLIPADGTANLQGLLRDGNRITSYALVNLEQGQADCTVRVFRSNGQPIGAAAVVSLPPLSHRQFVDPLAPETNLSGARATATCNRPFYAYITTLDLTNGDLTFAGPGEAASSTLSRPGEELPQIGACGTGIDCLQRTGAVFTPSRSTPTARIDLPFHRNIPYTKARLQLDVKVGNWASQQRDGIHHLFTLARGDSETRLGYAAVRGPSRNFAFFLHNLGLPGEPGNRFQQDNVQLQNGQTYHVDYVYDPGTGKVDFTLSRNGSPVVRLSDSETFVDAIRADGQGYFVELGLAPLGPHAPTYGWTYSNLKVEFFR
jgi:hypothetical protein